MERTIFEILLRGDFNPSVREADYFCDAPDVRREAIKDNGKQITLWADIRSASHAHMERAFAQRRRQILGDCRQLK
jgi:hypothetical protein